MAKKLPINFLISLVLIYLLYLAFSSLTAKNLMEHKTSCEQTVYAFNKLASNGYSAEAKVAGNKMLVVCKAGK